jgi:hypothetical protein
VYDVLDWLSMPEDTRPDFVTLYFDEPDHAGHNSGPESEEVNSTFLYLNTKLKYTCWTKSVDVNIILCSYKHFPGAHLQY